MGEVLNANTIKFYLFVGRATPPHSGHIHVIHETIQRARAGRTCALILLGDGPEGGLRTRANPIEHDTKADFIRHRLSMLRYEEPRDYVILKKDAAPVRQVVGFVRERIPPNITEISISQVAGDKDDDTIKLGWILTHSCTELQKLYPEIQISNGRVESVRPVPAPEGTAKQEKAMSATFVRETAVHCYDSADSNMDTAFTAWLEALPFYSEDERSQILSRTMFEQIIRYKDIISENDVIKAADRFLTQSGYNIDQAIRSFLDRYACYHGHEPTLLLLRNRFEKIIARRTNPADTSHMRYVKTTSAKPDPESGSAGTSKKVRRGGGSRRKHTRRRASNLRNKKTLRTNRRHNKHRHTRRRN
jgi:nicotinamide mononucleotide adenylyltransferase